jgi:Fe-S cluster assembly ATP-binding protein
MMEPDLAVLDETDSGLDIDALRIVARGITEVRAARPELGILLITHYQRILEHLTPDVVHILLDGRVVATGGPELAQRVEAEGFDAFRREVVA